MSSCFNSYLFSSLDASGAAGNDEVAGACIERVRAFGYW